MSTENVQKDDLKRIDGIGNVFESRLNAHGIYTYQQLASLSARDIASILGKVAGLHMGKIEQLDWAGQARNLADSGCISLTDDCSEKVVDNRSSSVTFSIELLLNKENQVRATTVTQCNSNHLEKWAGWNPEKILDFIVRAGGLPETVPNPLSLQQIPGLATVSSNDSICLTRLSALIPGGNEKLRTFRADQLFDVALEADISKLKLSFAISSLFTVDIYARRLGSHLRTLLGQMQAQATLQQPTRVLLKNIRLSEGIYRLEAVLTFGEQGSDSKRVSSQGDLLQVYAMGIHPTEH